MLFFRTSKIEAAIPSFVSSICAQSQIMVENFVEPYYRGKTNIGINQLLGGYYCILGTIQAK